MGPFELVSYRDISVDDMLGIVSTIPSNFSGWENYNSDESYSLKTLLRNNQRFDTGDYHFLLNENKEPVCGAGFYLYGDAMLLLARAYTWEKFRPGKWLSNTFLPMQIEKSRGKAREAWLTVNEYNRRILKTLARNGAVGVNGLKNDHDLYSQFMYDPVPVMINNVEQNVARFSLEHP